MSFFVEYVIEGFRVAETKSFPVAGSRSAKDEAPSTSTKERKTSSSEGKKRTTAKDDKEVKPKELKPKVRFWLFVNA